MDEMNTVGTLYIVATPIGNARDMTERGRQILETADIIAAEDILEKDIELIRSRKKYEQYPLLKVLFKSATKS